ncbi:hypothetical protein [Flavobacterium sp. FlaQc-48]|uniref:hypothetical protein n=1 Tax=Flavobacterium sp. FlaQc-48 TaxID=3374181 RepID=UPI0037577B10
MSYSITIHIWKKREQEFARLFYSNEKRDNFGFEDILQSYDSYSGFYTHFEASSYYFKKNIYDLARFLIHSNFTFQFAEGDKKEDKIVAKLLTEFIEDILKKKENKKLENLFSEIKSLPKKYCINNSLSYDYIDEWIEVVFNSKLTQKFYPNWVNLLKLNSEKLEIEKYLQHNEFNKIIIKQNKVPVFYYNDDGLIFLSFNNNWIDRAEFEYRSSENLSKVEQLKKFEFTFFLYDEEVIIGWILDLLKRNSNDFSDLISDADYNSKLVLSSDLILKIFIKPISIDETCNNF